MEDFVTFIKIAPQRVNLGKRPSKFLRLESLWSCSYEDLCEWDASLNSREKGTRLLRLRISFFLFLYFVFVSLVYFYLILKVLDLPIYFDIALAIFFLSVVVPPTLTSSSYHVRSPHPHPKVYSKILKEELISKSHELNKLVGFAFLIVIFIGIYIGYTESFGFSETYNRFLEIYNKFLGKDFVIVSIILTSIVIYIKLVKFALTNNNKHQNLSSFMSAYYQGYGKWKKSLLKIIKDSFSGEYIDPDTKKYFVAIKNGDWEYVRSTTVVYVTSLLLVLLIGFIAYYVFLR